jgi:hypothetical protein
MFNSYPRKPCSEGGVAVNIDVNAAVVVEGKTDVSILISSLEKSLKDFFLHYSKEIEVSQCIDNKDHYFFRSCKVYSV